MCLQPRMIGPVLELAQIDFFAMKRTNRCRRRAAMPAKRKSGYAVWLTAMTAPPHRGTW